MYVYNEKKENRLLSSFAKRSTMLKVYVKEERCAGYKQQEEKEQQCIECVFHST